MHVEKKLYKVYAIITKNPGHDELDKLCNELKLEYEISHEHYVKGHKIRAKTNGLMRVKKSPILRDLITSAVSVYVVASKFSIVQIN